MIPRHWRAARNAPRILTLVATPIGTTQINLSWTVNTGNVGLAGFKIYVNGAFYQNVNDVNALGAPVTGLLASTTYRLAVAPFDTLGVEYAATPVITQATSVPASGGIGTVTTSAPAGSAGGQGAATGTLPTVTASTPAGGAVGGTGGGSGTQVTTFALTSNKSGAQPFTIGHAFARGDVPTGRFVTANSTQVDARVSSRWPDGSVKIAIISGIHNLAANVAQVFAVSSTITAPSGSTVAEPTTLDVQVTLTGGVTGTYTLQSCLGVDLSAWNKAGAGRVRQFLGPVMSEFHYYRPTTDAHVHIWFFVRSYADGSVCIEIVLDNGWLKIAAPADKSYAATITVNGTQRYNGSLTHWSHTRWATFHWYGDGTSGTADIFRVIPQHNVAYFLATLVTPFYDAAGTPTAATLNGLYQSMAPLAVSPALSSAGSDLGGTGYGPHIGVLPQWDAAYMITGDARAYKSVIASASSAMAWPVVYRDENTGRPLAFSTRPNIDAAHWDVDPIVYGTTSNPQSYGGNTQAHMPSVGFLAFLLTGSWAQLENLCFWTGRSHMEDKPTSYATNGRNGAQSVCRGQDRGKAWHVRNLAQAATICPDAGAAADVLVRTDYVNALTSTFTQWQTSALGCALGYIDDMFNPGLYGELPDLIAPTFNMYFLVACVGYAWDLDVGLTSGGRTAHQAVRDHFYKLPVGMLGDSSGWCYRTGARFNATLGTVATVGGTPAWFSTWAQAYARGLARGDSGLTAGCAANSSLITGTAGGNFPSATSYWGNLLPAISYAVSHGATGAATAYTRMVGATNWSSLVADQPNGIEWAVKPAPSTSAAFTMPAWLASVPLMQWTDVGISPQAAGVGPAGGYGGTGGPAAIVVWSGAAVRPVDSRYIVHGGGHQDWQGNEHQSLSLGSDSPTWSRIWGPTPLAQMTLTADVQGDGSPGAIHTYYGVHWDEVGDRLVRVGSGHYDQGGVGNGMYSMPWPMNAWNPANTHPSFTGFATEERGQSMSQNGDVFLTWSFSRWSYRRATNAWTTVSTSRTEDLVRNATAYDRSRGVVWSFRHTSGAGFVTRWNAETDNTETKIALSGAAAALCNQDYQGIGYDPITDRVFILRQDGGVNQFYSFDPKTQSISIVSTTGTARRHSQAGSSNAYYPHGRFKYVPRLGGFVFLCEFSQPAQFIRTSLITDPYVTAFPTAENPISEGGIWTNGGTVGGQWQNVRTVGGVACGTGASPTEYDDNICILPQGRVNPKKHFVHMRVRKVAGYTPPSTQEIEMLLGFSLTLGDAHGYECDFGDNQAVQIFRWVGPRTLPDSPMVTVSGAPFAVADGDDIYGVYDCTNGSTVTIALYKNQFVTPDYVARDNSPPAKYLLGGAPGHGYFARPGAGLVLQNYGSSLFIAGNA